MLPRPERGGRLRGCPLEEQERVPGGWAVCDRHDSHNGPVHERLLCGTAEHSIGPNAILERDQNAPILAIEVARVDGGE